MKDEKESKHNKKEELEEKKRKDHKKKGIKHALEKFGSRADKGEGKKELFEGEKAEEKEALKKDE